MPNLNYAEQWSPELLAILIQGTLTSPFITNNVRWLDAKTFHFTQMSVSGYKNHKRSGGWNTGEYNQKDVPYTVTHDRDVQFMVDKISSIYFFAPGVHTEGDGYLYQNRQLSDTFVFPNGKDGKVDSVFVDVDPAEDIEE